MRNRATTTEKNLRRDMPFDSRRHNCGSGCNFCSNLPKLMTEKVMVDMEMMAMEDTPLFDVWEGRDTMADLTLDLKIMIALMGGGGLWDHEIMEVVGDRPFTDTQVWACYIEARIR